MEMANLVPVLHRLFQGTVELAVLCSVLLRLPPGIIVVASPMLPLSGELLNGLRMSSESEFNLITFLPAANPTGLYNHPF